MEEINKDQKAFWSGKGGEIWVTKQDSMDIMLSPLGEEAIKKLNLSSNENVLDIGCGCGSTTISIANEILNNGTISGIDISVPMIEKAKRSVNDLSISNIDFFVKDVQTENLGKNIFSSAYSRFGVMFFDDPFKAFSNILTSIEESGKLSFVCWQSPKLNPWQSLSVQAVREFIDLPSPPKRNPGPFAFQEKDYVNDILKKAGFKDIQIDDFQREIDMFYGKALEVEDLKIDDLQLFWDFQRIISRFSQDVLDIFSGISGFPRYFPLCFSGLSDEFLRNFLRHFLRPS